MTSNHGSSGGMAVVVLVYWTGHGGPFSILTFYPFIKAQ